MARRRCRACSPRSPRAGGDFDAIVIACFDDTGLAAARAPRPCPVIGIGEAAYHAALLLGRRFSRRHHAVGLGPDPRGEPRRLRPRPRCVRVRATEVPVLDIDGRRGEIAAEIAARWPRTAPRRSCSAAPAWPTCRPPLAPPRRPGDRRRHRRLRPRAHAGDIARLGLAALIEAAHPCSYALWADWALPKSALRPSADVSRSRTNHSPS